MNLIAFHFAFGKGGGGIFFVKKIQGPYASFQHICKEKRQQTFCFCCIYCNFQRIYICVFFSFLVRQYLCIKHESSCAYPPLPLPSSFSSLFSLYYCFSSLFINLPFFPFSFPFLFKFSSSSS